MVQVINISSRAAYVDSGRANYHMEAWVGGYYTNNDTAYVAVDMFTGTDGTGSNIGTPLVLGPVSQGARGSVSKLLFLSGERSIAAGARSLRVRVYYDRQDGSFNDGYVDNMSLNIYSD
jgi:hypothetical protein